MLSKRQFILISLAWLIIAVIFASIIRSSFLFGLGSWFNYKYFLHTHSHLAFLGWIFNIIYYFMLKQFNLYGKSKYHYLYLALNISVLGMLLTFPFQGYALWSIIFSTLHIILSFVFAIYFVRDTKGNKAIDRKFSMAAIGFMVISSIGPFALAPIISMGLKETQWYDLAIYFYLHFQYNGWFLLAILSFISFQIKNKDEDNWSRAYFLFVLSTILNFSLSTLWTNPGWIVNIISVLSSLMQIHAIILISKDVIEYLKSAEKFVANTMKLILTLFLIKVFFALTGSIQEVADFVYYNRNLVIGFLHLIFLGIVTPYFFMKIGSEYKIISKNYKMLLVAYFVAFTTNEALLTATAFGLRGETILTISNMIVYSTYILAFVVIMICLYIAKSKKEIEQTQ